MSYRALLQAYIKITKYIQHIQIKLWLRPRHSNKVIVVVVVVSPAINAVIWKSNKVLPKNVQFVS